jgi:hypothetical protein
MTFVVVLIVVRAQLGSVLGELQLADRTSRNSRSRPSNRSRPTSRDPAAAGLPQIPLGAVLRPRTAGRPELSTQRIPHVQDRERNVTFWILPFSIQRRKFNQSEVYGAGPTDTFN